MSPYKYPAVVIGGGINGLGITRNLGKNGVDVFCIAEKKNEAIYSKYCKKYFISSKVEHDLQELFNILSRIKHEFGDIGALFPISDISALNTSILNGKLNNSNQCIANSNVIRTLIEKEKFYRSLEKNRIPFPKTIFLSQSKDFTRIVDKDQFPVILKPSISQKFGEQFGKKGFIVNSHKELSKCLKITNKYNIDVFVQEIVPGPATNHYFIDGYFNKNSKPLAIFARQRLRMWPTILGNSSVCKSIPISDVADLKKTIVRYLSSIGFCGIFSAEFKKDSRDNVGKLLDVNARSWWYNQFPSSCGINIIFLAYLDSIGEKIKIQKNYEIDKKNIYLIEDLKWMCNKFFKGELSFQEWYSSLNGNRNWTLFDNSDIRPFIMKMFQTFIHTITHPRRFKFTFDGNTQYFQ